MIQTIITYIIIAAAVVISIIYFVKQFVQLSKKQTECSCCASKNTCSKYRVKSK